MKSALKRLMSCLLLLTLLFSCCLPALALDSATLYNGCKGDAVREIQQALIKLGYLKGTADGVFGNKTENAVRKFQKKNRLDVDGLVGKKTREMILKQASALNSTPTPAPAATPTPAPASSSSSASSGTSALFGNYSTMRQGDKGDRVKALQKALIQVKCLSGKADGQFGKKTFKAVVAFQKKKKLKQDGVAGKKTLIALEKAVSAASATPAPQASSDPTPTPAPAETDSDNIPTSSGPAVSSVKLLPWYDQVKPSLKNGNHLLVYDPSTRISWTLRVYSCGRHCDAEPLTANDTAAMRKAFGGQTTWTPKGVYVKLPDGRWSVASTHDTPHLTGSISSNNFNGHLCVHFYRTMEECSQADPDYGVTNQKTIRALWKSMTGENITE